MLFRIQEKFYILSIHAVSHIYRSSSKLYRQQWEYTYRLHVITKWVGEFATDIMNYNADSRRK